MFCKIQDHVADEDVESACRTSHQTSYGNDSLLKQVSIGGPCGCPHFALVLPSNLLSLRPFDAVGWAA